MDIKTTSGDFYTFVQSATPVFTQHLSSTISENSTCVTINANISDELGNMHSTPINNTSIADFIKNSSDAVVEQETNIRLSGPVLEMIYISTSILIIISNLVAVCVFLSNKKLRSQMDIKFLIWQSCVDFLAGIFLSVMTVTNIGIQDSHFG